MTSKLLIWGLVVANLPLVACESLNTIAKDLGDLADPPPTTVEKDGELLAEGRFTAARFEGNANLGAFLVAIELDENGDGRLFIKPDNSESQCYAGKLHVIPGRGVGDSLGPAVYFPDREVRIPFLAAATETEPSALRFTNFACEVDDVEVPEGNLPVRPRLTGDAPFAFTTDPGFLVTDAGNRIHFVDPWDGRRELVAENTSGPIAFAAGDQDEMWMWTLEAGQLVTRNAALRERFRGGDQIMGYALSKNGTGGVMVVYHDAERTVYTALASNLRAPARMAEDACAIRFNEGAHGRELIYLSPCGERRFVVHELDTGAEHILGSGIANHRIMGSTDTGPILLYLTETEPGAGVGRLWARWGTNNPVELGSLGHLALTRLSADGSVQTIVDWVEPGGTLQVGKVGEELEQIATGVAYTSDLGFISDFDGVAGSFKRWPEATPSVLGRRVTPRGIARDAKRDLTLFLADFDGGEGVLSMFDGTGTRELTDHVQPDAYQFTALLDMVTILSDFDPEKGTATLRLHDLDGGRELRVSSGVTEAVEVAFPRDGFLFSAPGRRPAGLYFAEAL